MDLLSYFRVLRRRWLMITACVIVGAGLGVASTLTGSGATAAKASTHYKATQTLLLRNSGSDAVFPTAFTNLDQISVLTTTGPVPDAVATKLGSNDSGPKLAERITTLTNPAASTLAITAVGDDPAEVAKLASTFSDELLANLTATDTASYNKANQDADQRLKNLQTKIDDLTRQIGTVPPPANVDTLQAQLRALENQYTQAYDNFQKVASQEAPTSPLTLLQKAQALPISGSEYNARLTQGQLGQNNLQAGASTPVSAASATSSASLEGKVPRGILGGFLGLLVGVGLAILMEHLDRRLRSRAEAEAAFGLTVLAEVPKLSAAQQREFEVVAYTQPLSQVAESYRSVRSSLLFQQLASANPADILQHDGGVDDPLFDPEHQQPMVVMVTSALPKEGKTTTSANLAAVFAEAGSNVLVVNCDFRRPMIHRYFRIADEPRRLHRTLIPGVSVVTNAVVDPDPNPARVVAAQRQLVNAARTKFDVVILDTAPLLSANDAIELVGDVDLVLLVAKFSTTTAPAAQRAVESLMRVEAPVAGVVLMGSAEVENDYYTYYQKPSERGREPRQGRRRRSKSAANGNGAGTHGEFAPPEARVVEDPQL